MHNLYIFLCGVRVTRVSICVASNSNETIRFRAFLLLIWLHFILQYASVQCENVLQAYPYSCSWTFGNTDDCKFYGHLRRFARSIFGHIRIEHRWIHLLHYTSAVSEATSTISHQCSAIYKWNNRLHLHWHTRSQWIKLISWLKCLIKNKI